MSTALVKQASFRLTCSCGSQVDVDLLLDEWHDLDDAILLAGIQSEWDGDQCFVCQATEAAEENADRQRMIMKERREG